MPAVYSFMSSTVLSNRMMKLSAQSTTRSKVGSSPDFPLLSFPVPDILLSYVPLGWVPWQAAAVIDVEHKTTYQAPLSQELFQLYGLEPVSFTPYPH